jgi:hypothetical protein
MAYNAAYKHQEILQHLERGDMDARQLSDLLLVSLPTLRRWLAKLVEGGDLFHYTKPENSAVRIYTLNSKLHKEDAYSRVKHSGNRQLPHGVIPGARVFLFDDPAREHINRAIMRSQRTKSSVSVYPGTSFGDVALRMP